MNRSPNTITDSFVEPIENWEIAAVFRHVFLGQQHVGNAFGQHERAAYVFRQHFAVDDRQRCVNHGADNKNR